MDSYVHTVVYATRRELKILEPHYWEVLAEMYWPK